MKHWCLYQRRRMKKDYTAYFQFPLRRFQAERGTEVTGGRILTSSQKGKKKEVGIEDIGFS